MPTTREAAAAPGGVDLNDESVLTAVALIAQLRSARAAGFAGALMLRGQIRPITSTIALLARLPRLSLPIASSPQGELIASRLAERSLGLRQYRIAQAALEVTTADEYLAGGDRRPLRKKLIKAERLGISTSTVSAEDGILAAKEINAQRHADGGEVAPDSWPVPENLLTWMVAYGPTGEPVAVQCTMQDRQVALLKLLHAVAGSEMSSPARHAIHQALYAHLADSGVRYLVSDSAIRAHPGVRQFMHSLGYRAWHLRPTLVED